MHHVFGVSRLVFGKTLGMSNQNVIPPNTKPLILSTSEPLNLSTSES